MTMRDLILSSTTVVWAILMFAAGLSWWMGADHGLGNSTTPAQVTIVLMLVAFFKVRLVIRRFMEVLEAPLPLKLITDGWIVVVCSAVIGLRLLA